MELRTPELDPSLANRKNQDQKQNINALNLTITSHFLSTIGDLTKQWSEYRQEVKMYNVFNNTGMKLMMKIETDPRTRHHSRVFTYVLADQSVDDMPREISLMDLQRDLGGNSNEGILNKKWSIELGDIQSKLLQKNSSNINEMESLASRNRIQVHQHGRLSMRESLGHTRTYSREDVHLEDIFVSANKPLQDIMFNAQGEKCFVLLDKGVEMSTIDNKKDKAALSESGLIMLIDVNDSQKEGVKSIYFNSLIQLRSELNYDLKIELECENMRKMVFDLHERMLH